MQSPLALLRPTALLDFQHPALADLVAREGWPGLLPLARVGAAYEFVRSPQAAEAFPHFRDYMAKQLGLNLKAI